ncbi:MAG: rny [Verrucomicrobiales bacterium]|nr:rny [Verrucomicrobiales bacterium]
MSLFAGIFLQSSYLEAVACCFIGAFFGYLLCIWKDRFAKTDLITLEKEVKKKAQQEAETIIRDARLLANEESLKLRCEAEKFFSEQREQNAVTEKRLRERESLVNGQLENFVADEKKLRAKEEEYQKGLVALSDSRLEVTELRKEHRKKLEAVSKLTEEEARTIFLNDVQQEAMKDAAHLSHHILEDAKLKAEEKARRIISIAIQRYAGDHAFETSTSTVTLPNDEIKGRIIGREGRNIRAFEAATGITVLIDDTPNAVVLSGFDPVRREIAREAMERLILDGRIHPTRIEEIVTKVAQEMDETIVKKGEEAVMKVGLPPLHIEIMKTLGRLHFRHSFSQNILSHSVEVAQLMGLMAAELGIDGVSAKRAGLLHDIGKALDHEIEGPHAIIGGDFVKRYGEADNIVNGVASHHGEVPHEGVLGILVSAADAISASRPGARSETMMTYIRRVEDLEKIGLSYPGVEKCYSVHAGRELRVFVLPDKVSDEEALVMARGIARMVEEKLQYPGQIRVTVMRETRCVEFAK